MAAENTPRDSNLEQLEREIEEARRRRKQASEAFESFVQSFGARAPGVDRSGSGAPPQENRATPPLPVSEPAPLPTTSRRVERAQWSVERTPPPPARQPALPPPFPAPDAAPAPAAAPAPPPPAAPPRGMDLDGTFADLDAAFPETETAPSVPPAHDAHVVPAALTPPPATGSRHRAMLGLAALVLVVGAFFVWRAKLFAPTEAPPQSTVTTPSSSSSPQPVTPAQAPAPQAAAPAAPAPAEGVAQTTEPPPPAELRTLRRVWVRVFVDGERTMERELDGEVRIPLAAKERVVVRTGDAGALRVLIRGKDQGELGPDGIVVTRAFTIPPAPPR